ncbi:MAG: PD-(D/E)XK nuclease family protein [Planctomycetota bacterium]|nr:PD-(D/E)XK nuclease family protein [Planctomycetota bacterium]
MTLPTFRKEGPPVERPVNGRAASITGKPHISLWQIRCMQQCPRRFFMNCVQHARPDFVAAALKFQRAIGDAVATHFRQKAKGVTLSVADLLHAYHREWSNAEDADIPVEFDEGQTTSTLEDQARGVLAAFLTSPLARPRGSSIIVQTPLVGTVDPELPDLLATLDLLDVGQEMLMINFKVATSEWSRANAAVAADELVLFRHVHHAVTDGLWSMTRPILVGFVLLTTAGRKPTVKYVRMQEEPGQLDHILDSIRRGWAAISAGDFPPDPLPAKCMVCPYRSRCPVFAQT